MSTSTVSKTRCEHCDRELSWEFTHAGVTRCERYLEGHPCKGCDDMIHEDCVNDTCFTCRELENNRRYRLHNSLGEYSNA